VDITCHDYDKHGLSRIPPLIWMLHDIEEPPAVHRQNDVLERDAAIPLELGTLLLVPAERFHGRTIHHGVPFVITFKKAAFRVRPRRGTIMKATGDDHEIITFLWLGPNGASDALENSDKLSARAGRMEAVLGNVAAEWKVREGTAILKQLVMNTS